MAEQFYTILTNAGKAAIANATSLGISVDFKYLALGDAGGSYYNPTESQTQLVNEVHRSGINHVEVDVDNPNWITTSTAIQAEVGGFMIRELGILDKNGTLLAIGKYPETYKPSIDTGSAKDLVIRAVFEVANADTVTLKIDPTVILATRKDLNMHKEADMPHMIKNLKTGKNYWCGFQIAANGKPQIIYEEVK